MNKRENKYFGSTFKYVLKKVMLQNIKPLNPIVKNCLGIDPFSKPEGRMVTSEMIGYEIKNRNEGESTMAFTESEIKLRRLKKVRKYRK